MNLKTDMRPERPSVARRIADARHRTGLTEKQLAERLGISLPAYCDLESYDDEAFTCLSLGQLRDLGVALGVPARQLLAPDGAGMSLLSFPMAALLDRVRVEIAQSGLTVEEFGERVGWDIASALAHPESAWTDWCVDGLQDICSAVGVDWLSVLP
jgi:hypothetical protein